ncbi:hypothetical protein Tco_0524072 [Tanacetum coccineum]
MFRLGFCDWLFQGPTKVLDGYCVYNADNGCNWAKIVAFKSSYPLSNALQMMGLRFASNSIIVFFSSGSGLTADSSVLTLTLAFLDFGLDFAQSFPFHAQFCHFGLAQDLEELTIKENSKMFVELMDKRKKHFARLRAEEQRRKPLTKAQKRNQIWIDLFVPVDSEVVKGSKDRAKGSETRAEGSFKRAGEDLQQESTKKQKMDDDKEKEELKQCFEIVPDDGDDVTIDATSLSVKIPIVDYKIYQEGRKSFFQIIRADGKTQMYLTFSKMLKNFDREDLEVLWRIVKARFKKTKPVDYMDTYLLLTLKTMFEHHVEDEVWKRQ